MKKNIKIEFEHWGLIDYTLAYARQRIIVDQVLHGANPRVIFCEHPAVITLGRMTKSDSLIFTRDEILANGINIQSIDRGGDVTMHAPGQLVVYVIINLSERGKDLKIYMQELEQVAVDLLRKFGILAMSIEGKRGVFVESKKIISIGVGIRQWVTFHGLGINVNNDVGLYRFIKPCGLDVQMTSMEKILKTTVPMTDVSNHFRDVFKNVFEGL